MIFLADQELTGLLHLRVAAQAKIRVGLDEHLFVRGTVRLMASRAALAQRLVFEHHALGLLAMTRRTLLVEARHRESAGGFHDVEAVWVVALHAVHLALTNGMVLRQIELGVDFQVTREARLRVVARIDDELSTTAARGDMFAARPVTRFASRAARHLRRLDMDSGVRTAREDSCVFRVAIHTGFVADKTCAFDLRRRDHRTLDG